MTGARPSRLIGLAVALIFLGGVTIACAHAEPGSPQPATGRFAPSGWTYLVADVEVYEGTPTPETLAAVASIVGSELDETIPEYRVRLRPERVEFAVPPDAELPPAMTGVVGYSYDSTDAYLELRPVIDAVPAQSGACPPDESNPPPEGIQLCDEDATELFTLEPNLLASYTAVASAAASLSTVDTAWVVDVELDDTQATQLADWSAAHLGERLAIVRDEVVLTAPTVQTELSGSVQIVGDFTKDEAELLAAHLHMGVVGGSFQVTSSGDNPSD